jgi:predicted component of type VI protein secretion system
MAFCFYEPRITRMNTDIEHKHVDPRVLSFVIPSGVENRAAREAARWTGRPKAERVGSERIKSLTISLIV